MLLLEQETESEGLRETREWRERVENARSELSDRRGFGYHPRRHEQKASVELEIAGRMGREAGERA